MASIDDALHAVDKLDNVSFFKVGLQLFDAQAGFKRRVDVGRSSTRPVAASTIGVAC